MGDMAAPVINSITFDKTSYNPGDTVTATVAFSPGTAPKSFTLTITATDSSSGATGQGTGTFSVNLPDATTFTGQDTGSRTWKATVSGTAATLTATA